MTLSRRDRAKAASRARGAATIAAARRHLARLALTRVRPPRDRAFDEQGRCAVCGRTGRLVFNSWVLPRELVEEIADPTVVHAYRRRESMFCAACGASLRVRRLAEVLLDAVAPDVSSAAKLVKDPRFRDLDVAEINAIGAGGSMHGVLLEHPRLAYSEYRGSDGLGEEVGGVRNEDITRMSYPDASLDLILTSDTLEHIPNPDAAFRECRRVLRLGGLLLFTVPMLPLIDRSVCRAEIGPDGRPRHRVRPQLHGYGSGPFRWIRRRQDAYLVFTDFGRDVVERLEVAGFQARLERGVEPGATGDAGIVLSATAGGEAPLKPGRGERR